MFEKSLRPGWPVITALAFLAAIAFDVRLWSLPESGPPVPCVGESAPSYADVDRPPNIRTWDRSQLGSNWIPPACSGWTTPGFSELVTIAGRFRISAGDDIRQRIGAISSLKGVRYWSTTHKQWQTLILDAYATSGPASDQRRKDFSAEEISEGSVNYYRQVDNLSGGATYRMHVIAASADRLVFETENVTTMRYLLVPLFHPGDVQSIYFLERESNDVWRYYSIVRTGRNASRLVTGHEASSVNRAVAYYRFISGISTDIEPPAAP